MTLTSPAELAGGSSSSADATASEGSLRRFLHGLPGVDQVGAEARAATLATRSIKTTAKAWAIDLAISMIDLTTLEGADTPGKVRALCAKAHAPGPGRPDRAAGRRGLRVPRPGRRRAKAALGGSAACRVASRGDRVPVAGGRRCDVKLADTRDAVAAGRRRDRHGDRPRRVPAGRYLEVLRRDRRGQGAPAGRAPQGDPRDRRARDVRQRPPRVLAGDARRGATSSRPRPARSRPRRRCRSRSSCSRRYATSATRPAGRSA